MHKVGHWIGLDTHDVGAYSDGSNFTQYEAGMVQTIEPGIYISSKSDVDDKWKRSESTRLNSSHITISYAVFCLKKKKKKKKKKKQKQNYKKKIKKKKKKEEKEKKTDK